jgi:hypothetical protein
MYTVKEKGGKPVKNPYHLLYSLRNPYRNLKADKSQDYAKKPQLNCTFMNSASCLAGLRRAVWRFFLHFQLCDFLSSPCVISLCVNVIKCKMMYTVMYTTG